MGSRNRAKIWVNGLAELATVIELPVHENDIVNCSQGQLPQRMLRQLYRLDFSLRQLEHQNLYRMPILLREEITATFERFAV